MATGQSDRFKRNARADQTFEVVDVRDDRQQDLAHGLHEHQRERRAHLRREVYDGRGGGRGRAVRGERGARDREAFGERRGDGQGGALGVLLQDLARGFSVCELELFIGTECV